MVYLSLSKINKSYNGLVVLDDVSFSIGKGQRLSIFGPSGAGKSTLLHIMAGLEKPSSGEIILEGKKYKEISDFVEFRRKNIGIVYQHHYLFPDFTVKENIDIVNTVGGVKSTREEILAFFDLLKLKDKMNSYPPMLSGGERSRVSLIRALINKPKLLLADEPTGNLDQKNADITINLLFSLAKEKKITLVLVTHDLSLAKSTDKVFNLEKK